MTLLTNPYMSVTSNIRSPRHISRRVLSCGTLHFVLMMRKAGSKSLLAHQLMNRIDPLFGCLDPIRTLDLAFCDGFGQHNHPFAIFGPLEYATDGCLGGVVPVNDLIAFIEFDPANNSLPVGLLQAQLQ